MTPGHLKTLPTIESLRSALRDRPLPPDGTRYLDRTEAAVAVVLRVTAIPDVLLIKRSEIDGDPWSGHMALPGGRREPVDTSSRDTAARETLEEVGLDLNTLGLHLGRLSDIVPTNPRLPPMAITPHVFAVGETPPLTPSPREVQEVHWVPLSRLVEPDTHRTVPIELGPTTKDFPALVLEDKVVWGLTHRILVEFLSVLEPLDGLP